MLIQTTHRQREQLKWHPLQWIANFNLPDQNHPQTALTLNRLCQWLSEKSQLPFYIIDPLKADVQALTNVMSQARESDAQNCCAARCPDHPSPPAGPYRQGW